MTTQQEPLKTAVIEIEEYRSMLAEGPSNLDRSPTKRNGVSPALALMLALQIAASTLAWLVLAVCAFAALLKLAGWL